MSIETMRRRVIGSFVILLFSLSLFIFATFAYFTDMFTDTFSGEVGFVEVNLRAYFDDGLGGQIPAQKVVIESFDSATSSDVSFSSSTHTISSTNIDLSVYSDGDTIRVQNSTSNDGQYTVSGTPTANALIVVEDLTDETAGASITLDNVVTKPGVYFINVVSSGNDYFFEDFRLVIDVLSNVNTYLRIKIYEQLTLIYTDYRGEVTELSILFDGFMPFNYDLNNWYDNRIYDNYIYYTSPIQRINETTPTEIGLISSYFSGEDFNTYSPGYSLQIAFSIEAIQSDGGPENVWDLTTPPWGGNW
ncbi:MAG: hypothetical protein JXL85_09880 [Bacilli bacterium]|nr:hypothetical protein [Bacilli bacterium]